MMVATTKAALLALRVALVAILGLPDDRVLLGHQSIPRAQDPHAVVYQITDLSHGYPVESSPGVFSQGRRLGVQVTAVYGDAFERLSDAAMILESHSGLRSALTQVGIGVVGVSGVRDFTRSGATSPEGRAVLELTLSYVRVREALGRPDAERIRVTAAADGDVVIAPIVVHDDLTPDASAAYLALLLESLYISPSF